MFLATCDAKNTHFNPISKTKKQTMKTQTNALQLELARVRNLKRALEAEVELLRSDSEQGKIHLRVNQSDEFRLELAKAIVDSSSSLSSLGQDEFYCVDPVEGMVYKKCINNTWNSWSKSTDWRIVAIEALFPPNYDFSPDIEDWSSEDVWEGCGISFRTIVEAFLVEEGEELEDNGDIPEWVWKLKNDVVSFAFDSEYGHYLEAIEAISKQRAIEFALESIVDEIVVEINQ